jgi:hypothetical protein
VVQETLFWPITPELISDAISIETTTFGATGKQGRRILNKGHMGRELHYTGFI